MQGEGQEFEPPRLHHSSTDGAIEPTERTEHTAPTVTQQTEYRVDPTRRRRIPRLSSDGSRVLEPSTCVYLADPLISGLEVTLEVTDQRIGWTGLRAGAAFRAVP